MDGLSPSHQNLCHVRCSHWRSLEFCTELGIHMRFNCIKFILQFFCLYGRPDMVFCRSYLISPSFPTVLPKLHGFPFRINLTANVVFTMSTYSEVQEATSSRER